MLILRKVPDQVYNDCVRIKEVLFVNGVDETLSTCETIWRSISFHTLGKDWETLPTTDMELWEMICQNTRVVD
jgi:hypothetical protein